MSERGTIREAVRGLLEPGPEALAATIRKREARLPALSVLREEVEGTEDVERLRLNAARFLAFTDAHRAEPRGQLQPPQLSRDPLQPRAMPIEAQIHFLYLSIWSPDRLPETGRPFPWAVSPIERAWNRLRSRDTASLHDYHYWLAMGRALEVPLGLLRLAVEEALAMALAEDPADFTHLDRLEAPFLLDPILQSDDLLGPALSALGLRVVYYRWLHELEADSEGIYSFAKDHLEDDLAGDPYLEASLRLSVLRAVDKGDLGEEGYALKRRLNDLLHIPEDPEARPVHARLKLSRRVRKASFRELDAEVGVMRGKAITHLDTALRAETPEHLLAPARKWLWEHWHFPAETESRARTLVAEVSAGGTSWERMAAAHQLSSLSLLPARPLESFHRLGVALRLYCPPSALKSSVICDLLIVSWLFEIPLDPRDARLIERKQPGHFAEGRIVGALCPALGLFPVQVLPAEAYGIHRLLQDVFRT